MRATPSLLGVYAKLRRAEEHLEELHAQITREGHGIALKVEIERDQSESRDATCCLVVESVPDLSARLSAISGDVIQNFRHALDHLIYELIALDNSGVYWEDSQFPVADIEARLTKRDNGSLKRLSASHRAFIESVQPYNTGTRVPIGNRPGVHWDKWETRYQDPLRVLRDLSNEDKHRLLLKTAMGIKIDRPPRWAARPIKDCCLGEYHVISIPGTLEPKTKLLCVETRITGADPQMEMDLQFTPFVSFRDYGNVEKVLDLIGAKVTQIVRQLEPAFR